jgi:uncharacterized membrane protein
MNGAHVHLIVNHIPVLGIAFGLGLLAYALIRSQQAVLKAALGLFVIAALAGGVAYRSGEDAEEIVEAIPGMDEQVMHVHEEAGELAAYAGGLLGLLALGGLVWARGKDVPRLASFATLGVGIVVSVLMVRAASLGGEIRHTEIRGDAVSQMFGGAPAAGAAAESMLAAPEEGDRRADDRRADDDE